MTFPKPCKQRKRKYRRKGIDDYDRKYRHLWQAQGGRCAVSGRVLNRIHKIDMHHILAKSEPNCRLYPWYIDSVWNLQLVYAGHHSGSPKAKHPPYYQIAAAECILIENPGIEWRETFEEAIKCFS